MKSSLVFALMLFVGSSTLHADPIIDSCTSKSNTPDGYQYSINVNRSQAEVLQHSNNARYQALRYELVPTAFAVSQETPLFSCVHYDASSTVKISVFRETVQVLKSSSTARFAPQQFRIIR